MAIKNKPERVSIAQARDQLARLVHHAEERAPVEITRRGHPVALLISLDEYERLRARSRSFLAAVEAFRADGPLDDDDEVAEALSRVRDRSPGRPAPFARR